MKRVKKEKQNWRKRIDKMSLQQKETAFLVGSLFMLIFFVAELAFTTVLERNGIIAQMVTEILLILECIINSLLYIIVGRKLCVTLTAAALYRFMSITMILIGIGMLWFAVKCA